RKEIKTSEANGPDFTLGSKEKERPASVPKSTGAASAAGVNAPAPSRADSELEDMLARLKAEMNASAKPSAPAAQAQTSGSSSKPLWSSSPGTVNNPASAAAAIHSKAPARDTAPRLTGEASIIGTTSGTERALSRDKS